MDVPPTVPTTEQSTVTRCVSVCRREWLLILFAVTLFAISRTAGASWFGRAERAVLVDRQLILVRQTHGGRGTIEGEAKPLTSET